MSLDHRENCPDRGMVLPYRLYQRPRHSPDQGVLPSGSYNPSSPVESESVSTKFPAVFYWYGGRRRGPGRPPRSVSKVLDAHMSGEADTTSGDPDATLDSGVDVDDRAIASAQEASVPETVHVSSDTNDTNAANTIQPPTSDDCPSSSTSDSAPRPACKYPLRNRRSGQT